MSYAEEKAHNYGMHYCVDFRLWILGDVVDRQNKLISYIVGIRVGHEARPH